MLKHNSQIAAGGEALPVGITRSGRPRPEYMLPRCCCLDLGPDDRLSSEFHTVSRMTLSGYAKDEFCIVNSPVSLFPTDSATKQGVSRTILRRKCEQLLHVCCGQL